MSSHNLDLSCGGLVVVYRGFKSWKCMNMKINIKLKINMDTGLDKNFARVETLVIDCKIDLSK
jgi:hypothetical protein